MDDLIYGISIEVLQEITGEELRVIKQWKKGTKRPSESAVRLINLFVHGTRHVHCSEIAGMASISGMGCYMSRNGEMASPLGTYAPCSFGSWR